MLRLSYLPVRLGFCAVLTTACVSSTDSTAWAESPRDEAPRARIAFFEEKIRPVLVQHCYKCHSAKTKNPKGALLLDTRVGIRRGGESGPAVVPGDLDESLIVDALKFESFEMPPAGKLPDAVIRDFETWIRTGAHDPRDGESKPVKAGIDLAAGREHWAFQPVRDPAVPKSDWGRNEIDGFVARTLRRNGLEPAPEADRRTLIRRVHFDVIGLPPTPEEIDAFVADEDPKAYEKLVDRLLASSHYGEKWGRHWLDLVRFAESDGFRKDDFRPTAYRYRDYVIRSLNDDKPYDRFVREQLAGDEIAPDDPRAVIATAYMRHYLYEYNQRDCRTQWNDILTDVTNVTGEVFLGMGIACARCHDHKFDPILQEDHFRLRAFFEPMLPRDDVLPLTPEERAEYETALAEWERATREIRDEITRIEGPYKARAAKTAIVKFPPDVRSFLLKGDRENFTPLQRQLADLVDRQVAFEYTRLKYEDADQKRLEELRGSLAEFEGMKPELPEAALTVTDVGPEAPPTTIPGDVKQTVIPPGYLSVLAPGVVSPSPPPLAPESTGRRTALANWIADASNPLSTRVIVNRIWQYHFGRGIVETTSDFGTLGEPPTHPELLDWLTSRFLEDGWRLKPLHRRILLSATYRQSAEHPRAEAQQLKDPRNTLFWRARVRRLDAEQVRDALLTVSGELDTEAGGPSVAATSTRRSVYTKNIRNTKDPVLSAFDGADGFNSTPRRNVTTTSTQALLMANGPWPLARADKMANRIRRKVGGEDDDAFVREAFRLAYGRDPESDERATLRAFLEAQTESGLEAAKNREPVLAELGNGLGSAAVLRPGSKQASLVVPDAASLPSGDFTVEAIVRLDSLYRDATVRTIASQWTSNTGQPGWAFGVTSTKSKYEPRNLILQLVGNDAMGKRRYEVVASNLRPELGRPYYLAVTVDIDEAGETGITFYMRDLSNPKARLRTASVTHTVLSGYRARIPLRIGGRHTQERHHWDGLVDRVRIADRVLPRDELLPEETESEGIVGDWQFESADTFAKDRSSHANHIHDLRVTATTARNQARHDLCHVLLNSSEFLYVD